MTFVTSFLDIEKSHFYHFGYCICVPPIYPSEASTPCKHWGLSVRQPSILTDTAADLLSANFVSPPIGFPSPASQVPIRDLHFVHSSQPAEGMLGASCRVGISKSLAALGCGAADFLNAETLRRTWNGGAFRFGTKSFRFVPLWLNRRAQR